MGKIICSCHKVIFDGLILKIRVGQFSKGHMNLKCPSCHQWVNGVPVSFLNGTDEILDLRKANVKTFF